MLTPSRLLQLEPAPVTVTVPCEPEPVADVGGGGGDIDDPPAVRDRERARAETTDIEPAAWSVDPAGARPVTVTVPFEPADNPTEPPPLLLTAPPSWIVSVPVPWPPITMFPAFDQLEPAPVTVTVPRPPADCRWLQSCRPMSRRPGSSAPLSRLADSQVPGQCARARDQRRIRRHGVDVCVIRLPGKAGNPVSTQEPIRGELPGPVGGLGVCRNRGRCEKRDRHKGRRRTKLPSPPRQQRAPCGRRASVRQYMPPIHTGPLLRVVRLHDRNVIALRAVETRHQ